ncbi:MAG: hypothetical protein LC115_02285 [Bacteroidia bacterium]|nr:hypothetical protein [Bacteroidia bacterium]
MEEPLHIGISEKIQEIDSQHIETKLVIADLKSCCKRYKRGKRCKKCPDK